MSYTNVMIAGFVLLGALASVEAAPSVAHSRTADWNGIRIQCSTKGGIARIETTPDQCRVQMDFGNEAAHTIVIKSDEMLLSSDVLGIEGTRKWEAGPCLEIKIAGARDRLAVLVVERHSASSSSESSSSRSTNGASTSARSSSTSTSVSTEVKSLEIATWNGKRIELSLKGGSSLESAIDREGDRCRIEFNIDKGKHKRFIALDPGVATLDGSPLDIDGDYSEFGIKATRKSLAVTVDGDVIARWKGDMQKRLSKD